MVLFVSQCEKNALKKTRRVLDSFADRIGDNTWQTVITNEGLQAVKKLLRKNASKNTAVSCHWIRSRSRSQFLWVVGSKDKFNNKGIVPVNRTEQDLPSNDSENNWKHLPLIKTFTGIAALLHDWGKATKLFQDKLDPNSGNKYKADPLRHEWISSLLFMAFIRCGSDPNQDESWLESFIKQKFDEDKLKKGLSVKKEEPSPFRDLPDAASLVLWLILSHHRLPKPHKKDKKNHFGDCVNDSPQKLLGRIDKDWGYKNPFDDEDFKRRLPDCFTFPEGLLSKSSRWVTELSRRALQLKEQLPLFKATIDDGSWRTIAHHARLCLMLGDHYYSSQDKDGNWQSPLKLYANTSRAPNLQQVQLKQKLDEHLVRVAEAAVKNCGHLPFLESRAPIAQDICELKPKKNMSQQLKRQFGWQDKAVIAIQNYRHQCEDKIRGYFVVNMASTGRGKTLANAKIMQALSDDQKSLRFILALGLRTLTLQTGEEYRNKIGLKPSELAVLIGSKSILELHKETSKTCEKEEQIVESEELGSESSQSLMDEQDYLDWNHNDEYWSDQLPEEELTTVLKGPKERALLYAPVLACTIDHIIGATETTRGGRYILPSLRLMSSDLVIDEVDDFVGEDLVAIGRLIYLAGMLGRKVMISSATIPPDLALSYFTAYKKGWGLFACSRNLNTQVACSWTDEFKTYVTTISQGESVTTNYQKEHKNFVDRRVALLRKEPIKHRANIIKLPKLPKLPKLLEKVEKVEKDSQEDSDSYEQNFFSAIRKDILDKHQNHHERDKKTDRRVSFGVVRCANILPCVKLTKYLLDANTSWPEGPEGVDVRIMSYHSQQVLLLRHSQEQHLDQVLKRKALVNDLNEGAFYNPDIRKHLDSCKTPNLIFILVATPVEEVGRDHDFDWAVIEPSSYRSIIQLAGRVRRHRGAPDNKTPNIGLLQYNLKGYRGDEYAFSRPGYEKGKLKLFSKNLCDLVDADKMKENVSVAPRLIKDSKIQLAAIEHVAISRTLGCPYLNENDLKGELSSGKLHSSKLHSGKLHSGKLHSSKLHSGKLHSTKKLANNPSSLWGYTDDYWWMTALPQQFNRFRNSEPGLNLYRVLDNQEKMTFKTYDKRSGWVIKDRTLGIESQSLDNKFSTQRLWLVRDRDYKELIKRQSKLHGEDPETISQRFGEINLSFHKDENRYLYSDQLGLIKK